MDKVAFVTYDEEFLKRSWDWLNDPDIKLLTGTPDFTREEQVEWFNSLQRRNDYKVWGMNYGDKKIGVVGLKNIRGEAAEYFGYIGQKEFWNRGISRHMIDHTVHFAQKNNIKKIHLRVRKGYTRAIRAYEKYGFTLCDKNEKQLIMSIDIHGS